MAKAGRDADQYMLRFPPGLRDRIKAYAERMGTSINSEIIRVLELEFPVQWPIDDRLDELADLLTALAAGRRDERFQEFSKKLEETLQGIISGRVTGVDEATRAAISNMWQTMKEREAEDLYEQAQDQHWGRTDDEIAAYEVTGQYEKYVEEPPAVPDQRDKWVVGDLLPPKLAAELRRHLERGNVDAAKDAFSRLTRAELLKHKKEMEEAEQRAMFGGRTMFGDDNEEPPSSGDPFPDEV